MRTDSEIIRKAIQEAVSVCGGQSALARQLCLLTGKDVRQAHVWNWLNRTKALPAEYAVPVERATGGLIPRHRLRPDLFEAPMDEATTGTAVDVGVSSFLAINLTAPNISPEYNQKNEKIT